MQDRPQFSGHRVSGLLAKVVVLGALVCGGVLRADEQSACPRGVRTQDQLWAVSCRSMGCGNLAEQTGQLRYWRYDREKSWVASDLAALAATDENDVVTTIFVHGNRVDHCEAFSKGWDVYHTLVACAGERPVRFVVWLWPSDQVRGPINDARVKAARTDPAGYYLGWFVDQLSPDVPVSLWAHSYGARVATAGLHLLGGGTVRGTPLTPRQHPTRQAMPTVLIAAAIDSDWLCPGHCHGQAFSQMASLVLVNNSCDMLLKRYHRLYGRRSCQQALGYTGLGRWGLPDEHWAKTTQIDACAYVGRQHILNDYLRTPSLVARMRPPLLFAAASGASAQAALASPDESELEQVASD